MPADDAPLTLQQLMFGSLRGLEPYSHEHAKALHRRIKAGIPGASVEITSDGPTYVVDVYITATNNRHVFHVEAIT